MQTNFTLKSAICLEHYHVCEVTAIESTNWPDPEYLIFAARQKYLQRISDCQGAGLILGANDKQYSKHIMRIAFEMYKQPRHVTALNRSLIYYQFNHL